jgi:outer membrane lipoprotein SlyB
MENKQKRGLPHFAALLATTCTVLALSACAVPGQDFSASGYNAQTAMQTQRIFPGTVISVREIHIEDNSMGMGTVLGGAGGGVLGVVLNNGKYKLITGVLGAVVGGSIGNLVDHAAKKQNGLEIVVRTDAGNTFVVPQSNDIVFHQGDRVGIIADNTKHSRVVPLNQNLELNPAQANNPNYANRVNNIRSAQGYTQNQPPIYNNTNGYNNRGY